MFALLSDMLACLFGPQIDWSQWYVFFCDERCVPLDHADSNYRAVKAALLDRVPIREEHVFPITEAAVGADASAAEYEARLVATLGDPPVLDMLLLGMGECHADPRACVGVLAVRCTEPVSFSVVHAWVLRMPTL